MFSVNRMLDWTIKSHGKVRESIERDLKQKKLAQTLLIIGPPEIGKFSLARDLAKLIHEENIEVDNHIDTFVFAKDGNSLGIKEFRELKNHLNLSPQKKFKVVLIQNIERLSIPLQNAMLKILEEPPSYVFFVLTSSGLENVLDTIVSRARVYKTGLATSTEMREFLGDVENSDFIEILAAGKIGRAKKLKEDTEKYNNLADFWKNLEELNKEPENQFKCLKLAESLAENERGEVLEKLEVMAIFWRQKMLKGENPQKASENVEACFDALDHINKNVNLKLSLEVLFLHCFTKSSRIESQILI